MLVFGVVGFWVVQVWDDDGVAVNSVRRRRKRIEGGGAIVVWFGPCLVKDKKRKEKVFVGYIEREGMSW